MPPRCRAAPTASDASTPRHRSGRIDKLTHRRSRDVQTTAAFGRGGQRPRLAALRVACVGAAQRGRARRSVRRRARHRQAARADASAVAPLEPFAAVRRAGQRGARPGACRDHPADAARRRQSRRRDGGFLDQLQANAEKLVRIRPVGEEPRGDDRRGDRWRGPSSAPRRAISRGAPAELAKLPPRRPRAGAALDRQGPSARHGACGEPGAFAADARRGARPKP